MNTFWLCMSVGFIYAGVTFCYRPEYEVRETPIPSPPTRFILNPGGLFALIVGVVSLVSWFVANK